MHYAIAYADNPHLFAEKINEAIAAGYVPYGNPYYADPFHVQAMIKNV